MLLSKMFLSKPRKKSHLESHKSARWYLVNLSQFDMVSINQANHLTLLRLNLFQRSATFLGRRNITNKYFIRHKYLPLG